MNSFINNVFRICEKWVEICGNYSSFVSSEKNIIFDIEAQQFVDEKYSNFNTNYNSTYNYHYNNYNCKYKNIIEEDKSKIIILIDC